MRSRSYSKPTREEWRTINHELSLRDAEALRQFIKAAMNESPEVASVMMRIISVKADNHLLAHTTDLVHVNAQHQSQSQVRPNPLKRVYSDSDGDGDSEMSGTENSFHTHNHHGISSSQQSLSLGNNSRKRKSLFDRDMNIPTPPNPDMTTASPSMKRHCSRESLSGYMALCSNCGNVFGEQHGKLHACLYHPGSLELGGDNDAPVRNAIEWMSSTIDAGQLCRAVWTCCMQDGTSAGCLITRHANSTSTSKSEFLLLKERGLRLAGCS